MQIEMKEQSMWDRLFVTPFSVLAAIVGFVLMVITLAGWGELQADAVFFFAVAVVSRFEEHLRQIRANTTAMALIQTVQEVKRARTAAMWAAGEKDNDNE